MNAVTHRETTSCRRAGKDQPRLRRTHLRDCNTSGCPGCEPCPERHCQKCQRHHVTVEGRGTDLTCIECLSETRTKLAGILTLCTRLLGEAIVRGINSEAAMLTGPAADVEIWGYRRMSALAGRIDPKWLDDIREEDELHPLWILGTWEREVRNHLGQVLSPGSSKPTLTEARDYLHTQLHIVAHDETFAFEEMAEDIAKCHSHLEAILAEGDQVDDGAPCPVCGRAKLLKDYGEAPDDDVMWHCPKCDNWWTDENYRDKILGVYVGVADRLTASQIHETYRVPEGTTRSWAERGKVAKRGKDAQGRMLYDVEQVLAARDEHEERLRKAATKKAAQIVKTATEVPS